MSNTDYKISSKTPQEWLDADAESPNTAPVGSTSSGAFSGRKVYQNSHTAGVFAIANAGLAAGVAGGVGWWAAENYGIYNGPWLAPLLAVLIALAVRIAGDGHNASARATISVAIYALTVVAVTVMLTRTHLLESYGSLVDWSTFEDQITGRYFRNASQLLAYAAGAFLAVQLSFMLKNHKPGRFS